MKGGNVWNIVEAASLTGSLRKHIAPVAHCTATSQGSVSYSHFHFCFVSDRTLQSCYKATNITHLSLKTFDLPCTPLGSCSSDMTCCNTCTGLLLLNAHLKTRTEKEYTYWQKIDSIKMLSYTLFWLSTLVTLKRHVKVRVLVVCNKIGHVVAKLLIVYWVCVIEPSN